MLPKGRVSVYVARWHGLPEQVLDGRHDGGLRSSSLRISDGFYGRKCIGVGRRFALTLPERSLSHVLPPQQQTGHMLFNHQVRLLPLDEGGQGCLIHVIPDKYRAAEVLGQV